MGEVAFHFLNNQSHFNPEKEEHYYLLWKICSLTIRNQVKKRIKETYKTKFPGGRYYSFMRDGITLNQAMSILLMPLKNN